MPVTSCHYIKTFVMHKHHACIQEVVSLVSRELMDILPDNLLSILAPGSCVVITSRSDECVLPECAVHDLALLSSSEARRVFCHHAGIDIYSMEDALEDASLPEEHKEWVKRISAVITKCSGGPHRHSHLTRMLSPLQFVTCTFT